MKVLIVASYADSLRAFRGPLLEALTRKNHSVYALAPMDRGNEAIRHTLEGIGVTFHPILLQRTGLNPLRDLQTLWQLYRLMKRERAQVVLAYTVKPVVWGLLGARLAGVPHRFALITGLGYAFTSERKGFVSKVVRLLYRLALSNAEKVFFQNPDDESLFRQGELLPVQIPSVIVNGSGIDVTQFQMAQLPTGDAPSFLLIARLLGDKGVREYIAAARQIKAVHPSATFKVVGWIDENPDAIQQDELNAWVSEGVVDYLGKLSDVRPAIREAAVYVLPSYREGTPRTVLEAMAMGRPIITTDAPGCRETVIDGENGFLVPVKDVDALAQAMLKFIEEPELIASMGKRSREIAEEKYDVNKVNAVMLREMGL